MDNAYSAQGELKAPLEMSLRVILVRSQPL